VPNTNSCRTDNPDVAKLLIAHEVATTLAHTMSGIGSEFDLDKYLETFDRVYKAIKEATKPPEVHAV
jgi:hypothetical protein